MISEDFSFSILFSTGGDGATDFHGGRPELEGYLDQREVGVRTHHVLAASTVGGDEAVPRRGTAPRRAGGELRGRRGSTARAGCGGRHRACSPAVLFT